MTNYRLAWLDLIYTRDALYTLIFVGALTGLFWYHQLKKYDLTYQIWLMGGALAVFAGLAWGLSIQGG